MFQNSYGFQKKLSVTLIPAALFISDQKGECQIGMLIHVPKKSVPISTDHDLHTY